MKKMIDESILNDDKLFISLIVVLVSFGVFFSLILMTNSKIPENDKKDCKHVSIDTTIINIDEEHSTIELDITNTTQVFEYLGVKFTAFIYDSKLHQISFFYKNEYGERYGSISNLKENLEANHIQLRFGMNAGIFTENKNPEGLFVNEGKVLTELNLENGYGNFYLKPNGVFFITKEREVGIVESNYYATADIDVEYATQSGPLLLQEKQIHKAFNQDSPNLRVRNGVGVISSTKAVFLIAENPINFYNFTRIFQERFACTDALYLDGVISEMYLPEEEIPLGEQEFSGIIGITSLLIVK